MARPMKPHSWSWGETTLGIRSVGKGVWRLTASGERFTEHDERQAYLRWKKTQDGKTESNLERTFNNSLASQYEQIREWILNNPQEAARCLRMPQLAYLHEVALPSTPLGIATLRKNFEDFNSSSKKSKRETLNTFDFFVSHTGIKTLADISVENLKRYRAYIEEKYSGSTIKAYYSRVRGVLAFGRQEGLDSSQIDAALSKMDVLYTDKASNGNRATPISRADFHTLCNADENWKAWLIIGLNLCLHLGEVCDLEWQHFDLENGTYWNIRGKTEAHNIPRAATLFPETIAILNKLPRKSKWVFTSSHGKNYNNTGRGNDFREFVDKVLGDKCPRDKKGNKLNFEWIRDGAYTASWKKEGLEGKLTKLFGGHSADGMSAKYVEINPEIVAPACKAAHKEYFE